MPSFLLPAATSQPFLKTSSSSTMPTATSYPSASSKTTLSQRFRRAIKQGDLELAKRISSKAIDLQQHRRPSAYKALEPPGLNSPNPPKAALRAAIAQRPSSSQPFDIRNIEKVETDLKKPKIFSRPYSLGINYDELAEDDSESSLVLAIKNHADVELIRWLIEMGHERKGPSKDAYGHTVLHLCALYDRADVIYAYSTYSSGHMIESTTDLIDSLSHHDHRTALHLACIKGYEDVARQLLDLGANIDLPDREGNTALHCASSWGHLSLVQLLIERGCSFAAKNVDGFTAADFAFTHSVKAALEAFGRAQFEGRKRARRAQAHAFPGSNGLPVRSSFDDDYHLSTRSVKSKAPNRPVPLALTSSAKGPSGAQSTSNTPVFSTFTIDGKDISVDRVSEVETPRTDYLYDDWDPERTFAQPGQDLHPSTRQVSSPTRPRNGGGARPSVDLFAEVMSLPLSPPPSSSDGFGSVADQVRLRDAAAMSLFRNDSVSTDKGVGTPASPLSSSLPVQSNLDLPRRSASDR